MKRTPIERLMDTHPELEIWWDSSPLVYASWAEGLNKKATADPIFKGHRNDGRFCCQTISRKMRMKGGDHDYRGSKGDQNR
jgi:hypothetical protein